MGTNSRVYSKDKTNSIKFRISDLDLARLDAVLSCEKLSYSSRSSFLVAQIRNLYKRLVYLELIEPID